MNDALSEERKAMVCAISSGRPKRLSGTLDAKRAFLSSVPVKRFSIPVSIGPGATMLMRTPDAAASSAADWEDPSHLVSSPGGWVQSSPHRALDISEIPGIVEDYRKAAARAKAARFDGVELHAANGYLVDQFLQDGSNRRTDAYGGSIENRSRFLLEVVEAITSVWGGGRVAVRIAPAGTWNHMRDSNPTALFTYVAQQLNRFGLAYLPVIEPRVKGNVTINEG